MEKGQSLANEILSPSAQSVFVPYPPPPPCLQLQIVVAIVLSFQVLKFLVLWLRGPFSVRSASSTPLLLFHSLFEKKKKKSLFYVFHNVFSVRVRVDGQEGKKSLSGVGWSKMFISTYDRKNQHPTTASVFQKHFDWQLGLANAVQSLS